MTNRLTQLRDIMQRHGAAFFMVPSSDAHRSEYVPDIWQRRPWISGFTGSAGDVVVGRDHAWLWTDGRYTLQAEQELDLTEFSLENYVQGAVPAIDRWMGQLQSGSVFALDPKTITISQGKRFESVLSEVGCRLMCTEKNFVDQIRTVEPAESAKIFLQSDDNAGQTAASKLEMLRAEMQDKNADAIVLNVLDDIAWMLNIRGGDSDYNPLVISYLAVEKDKILFFVNTAKVTNEVQAYFDALGVKVVEYEAVGEYLEGLSGNVWLDASSANYWMDLSASNAASKIYDASPVEMKKAVKNAVEQAGAIEAHRKDGVSLVKFFHWLENNWQGQTELSVSDKLLEFRQQDPSFVCKSFETIAGFGPNGAVIHYRVTEDSALELTDQNLFLLDSGGQYPEGTTDVTRVMHFGTPTAVHKEMYTRVLKGHLALRRAVFCAGTRGEHLDAVARMPIWAAHANYAHGTGHGVGSFLCVHEGPQRISTGATKTPLQAGMIVSNEPGVYVENEFGIRVENLCLTVQKASIEQSPTNHGPFYGFEDLTLVPYERKLIDMSLLSSEEIEQVNAYHQQVFDTLSPSLDANLTQWLKAKTEQI